MMMNLDEQYGSGLSWGKSYGGHDDVQTVFGQAILVAEFSPKKIQIISFRRRPPRLLLQAAAHKYSSDANITPTRAQTRGDNPIVQFIS
jgi:hypothetical protein